MKQTKQRPSNRAYKIPFKERKAAESAKIVKNFAGQSIANLFVLSLYLIITSMFFTFFLFAQLIFIETIFGGSAVNSNKVLSMVWASSFIVSFYLFIKIKNQK
jgi:hypothetical protein